MRRHSRTTQAAARKLHLSIMPGVSTSVTCRSSSLGSSFILSRPASPRARTLADDSQCANTHPKTHTQAHAHTPSRLPRTLRNVEYGSAWFTTCAGTNTHARIHAPTPTLSLSLSSSRSLSRTHTRAHALTHTHTLTHRHTRTRARSWQLYHSVLQSQHRKRCNVALQRLQPTSPAVPHTAVPSQPVARRSCTHTQRTRAQAHRRTCTHKCTRARARARAPEQREAVV
jgi:hypothetical protein